MNKTTKLFLGLILFLVQASYGQTYNYPKCNSQDERDLKIVKVVRGDYSTTINFEYSRREEKGIYILLNKPNTKDAYFIRIDGRIYKLTSTSGIGNENGITAAYPNTPVYFSATFEPIPKAATEFDLIEGASGTWHFYGIQLISSNSYPSASNNNNSYPSTNNLSNECDNIINTSATPKPEINTFLAGVKYAVIMEQPKINGHVPAFNGLIELLKAMGFESVEYLDKDYVPAGNPCEEVWIDLGFQYDLYKYYNVKWSFLSPCLGYSWDFTSNQSAAAGIYDDGKNNFYRLLRNMYQYKKPDFNSNWTLKKASQKTCWTEYKIKEIIKSKGCDRIEGIYENSSSATSARYKVAVRKINGTYHFIYLSGTQSNSSNWSEGDIKATLEPTATQSFYKAKWYMADKTINDEFYVSFEQGSFNLLNSKSEKELYIKLFPSTSDNISAPSDVQSSGSGFAISSNGYVVTNYHVTQGATKIKVRGINGDFSRAYSARVITDDKNNDLSIIKIDDPSFTTCGAIPYTINSRASEVGTSVFVLGYPLRATMGDEIKLTNGIISSKSGFQGDITAYQMTAPIQPGNSGGPMFDNKGNLVGVVNAKHRGAENASYAIKSSYLLTLIDLLPSTPTLQTINQLNTKPLTEQVKIVKRFTYIIEVN
jgi:S1-C subfamily serine protease